MARTISVDGYRAVIEYDPDIEMFRGEFVGLNGGADFYARDAEGLKREAKESLEAFLEMCREDGVEPRAGSREGAGQSFRRAVTRAPRSVRR